MFRCFVSFNFLVIDCQKMIALNFSQQDGSGLVIKFQRHHEKYQVQRFDCQKFSAFPEEKETLFFGAGTVLRIEGILLWAEGRWQTLDRFMEPLNALLRVMKGQSLTDELIMRKKKYQKAMRILFRDILKSQISETNTKTPKYVLNLALFHHSSTPNVRLLYHEMLAEYKWLHSILRSDSTDTLDIANIAVLFCQSETITFLMPHGSSVSHQECESLLNGLVSINTMALPITIQFEWPVTMSKAAEQEFVRIMPKLKQLQWRSQLHMMRTMTLEKAVEFVENQAAEQAFKSRVEQVIADLSGRSTEAEEEKQSKMQTVEPTLPTPPVTYDLTDDLVVNIDRGLQRWYQHCGRGSDYDSLFANFCEESTL